MAELTGVDIPLNPNKDFWDIDLPMDLEQKLTDPDLRITAPFDYLVLDEAQDVLARPSIWGCLTQLIEGNLKNGKYALLGDFDHQVLGEREALRQALDTLIHEAKPSKWKLLENCRNYSIIGETAVRLSGFEDKVYTGYMRQGGSIANYNIDFYSTEDEQAHKLSILLKEFKQHGYRPEEITILSFLSAETCVATNPILKGFNIRPEWQQRHFIHYCTVHAFKGLENKVIILTDVSANETASNRDLFYIGMTRATESVRVLCTDTFKDSLLRWLVTGGFTHV
jgi:superfamily I DNA/RNA helicase